LYDFSYHLSGDQRDHDAVIAILGKLTKLLMYISTRTDRDTVETARCSSVSGKDRFLPINIFWIGLEGFISIFWNELFILTQTRLNVKSPSLTRRANGEDKQNSGGDDQTHYQLPTK
jgi:hypothetical protein